jgi:SAM-dependent methyltransferase
VDSKGIWGRVLPILCDPATGKTIEFSDQELRSSTSAYPMVRGVPRFVSDDRYSRSFSFQWNAHSLTQLDSFRGGRGSEDEFVAKTGCTPSELKGKLVLDAGVGAGRYSEIVSRWGADVVGVDLSYAVEAAYANLQDRPNVWIAQADIAQLPFRPASFDVIFSIGVLHHTPNTRDYFLKLVPLLKPGGLIAVWVYPKEGIYPVRQRWVKYVNKIPPKMYYEWCRWFVPWVHSHGDGPWIKALHRIFPYASEGFGLEYDILDTFDGFSPRYHWIHSPEEVVHWFEEAGLDDIVIPSRWSTCVRGRKADKGLVKSNCCSTGLRSGSVRA